MIIKFIGVAVSLLAVVLGFGQTRIDLRGQARNIDFADAMVTKPFVVGTTLPGACTIGEAFFKSDAAPGENLYLCTATNIWVLSGPAAPYTQEFVGATDAWIVTGATHGLGTEVEVFVQEDGGTNWKRAYAGSVLINKTSGDVTVSWSEPRAGRILISQLRGGRGRGSVEAEAHAPTHKHGGSDEIASAMAVANGIPKADGTGKLSITWVPQGSGTDIGSDLEEEAHAAEHKHGGADEIGTATPAANEIPKADGTGKLQMGWIPQGSGTDVGSDLEEEAHAAEHKHGGADEIGTATPAANEIPKADGTGKLQMGWIPQGSGTDIGGDLEEEAHAAEHKHGGADEISTASPGANEIPKADATGKLQIGWIPQGSGTDIGSDLEEEAHAAEHKHGGDDEIGTETPGANEIPKADGTGKLQMGWIPQGSGTDIGGDLEEEAHAAEHKHGGADEISTATPGANEIPKADATGKLAAGWLPQSATLTTPNYVPFVGTSEGGLSIDTATGRQLYRDPTSGNIGVGTTSPLERLSVSGNLTATGSIGIGSYASDSAANANCDGGGCPAGTVYRNTSSGLRMAYGAGAFAPPTFGLASPAPTSPQLTVRGQASGYWLTVVPDEAGAKLWNMTSEAFTFPGDTASNQVVRMGWNVGLSGTRYDGTRPSIADEWESHYCPTDLASCRMERHVGQANVGGSIYRPYSFTVGENDASIEQSFTANKMWFHDPAGVPRLTWEGTQFSFDGATLNLAGAVTAINSEGIINHGNGSAETSLRLRPKVGQGANVFEARNPADVIQFAIDGNGSVTVLQDVNYGTSGTAIYGAGQTVRLNGSILAMAAAPDITWSSTTHAYDSADTGISRSAAGLLEINNGTAGQYRDLQIRALNPSTGRVGIGTTSPTVSGTGKLHVAGNTIRLETPRTPGSASEACNQGEISWDANYVYVCIATSTWRRSAITAW